jgi:WD40 repeat protein
VRQPLHATLVVAIPMDPPNRLVPRLAHDGRGGVVLLTASGDGDVRRWNTGTGELLWHFSGADLVSEVTVACPPGSDPVMGVATDMGVERLNADSGLPIPDEDLADVDTIWDITSGLLPDGRAYIAGAGHVNGLVHIWDAATARPLGPLTGHDRPVKTLASATLADGTPLLASQDEAGVLRRWNAATAEAIGEPSRGPAGCNMRMGALTLPNGRVLLASLDIDGMLTRWDAATGAQIGTVVELGENAVAMTGASLGGNGRLMVSYLDGLIEVRDAVTGDVIAEFHGVTPSALTRPDGSVLLAVGNPPSGEIRLFRLESPSR